MSSQNEKQKIAREALKILRADISKEADPIEALKSYRFLMMSSIELDIWKTTQQILKYLSQNKTELASSLLEKLKELVQESDWE
jgi:hypothetical protein